jgi:hypothetical protein
MVIPRDQARTQLDRWTQAGVSTTLISKVSGVPLHTIQALVATPTRKPTNVTANKLVQLPDPPEGIGRVPVTAPRRQLQSLSRIGWTLKDIADRTGMPVSTAASIRGHGQATVPKDTATAVRRLFADLWNTPGNSKQGAKHAAAQGWHMPMCWDDDTIHNPDHEPTTCCEPQTGGLPDDIDFIVDLIRSDGIDNVANRIGMQPGTLQRALYRNGY